MRKLKHCCVFVYIQDSTYFRASISRASISGRGSLAAGRGRGRSQRGSTVSYDDDDDMADQYPHTDLTYAYARLMCDS